MGSERRRFAFAAVFVGCVAAASTARAAPTATEKETARGLMDEGEARRAQGDMKGALASFTGADAIMHVPSTGFEVARAQVALGMLVEARDTVQRVLRIPARSDEPPPFVAARRGAAALDAELAARIPAIRVFLGGPLAGDAHVTIDDVALPVAVVGEPFKVDPGHHVVRATASGGSAEASVDLAEKETRTVTLQVLRTTPVATTAPEGSPSAPAAATRQDEAGTAAPGESRSHTMRTLLWGSVALAGVGVVVGSVAGIVSLSQTSTARGACQGNRCPTSDQGQIDSAYTSANIANVAFVVAGVGAAGAVIAFLVGDRPSHAEARLAPWVGPGAAGVRGSF